MEHDTYIMVYGAMKSPHLLPWFVPEKLVLQEVAYQIVINGVWGMLYKDKKSIWPPLPLYIDTYFFANTKQAQEEVDVLYYCTTSGKRGSGGTTLKKVVKEHFNKLGMPWEYTSEVWEEEEIHCNTRNYDEVVFKR
jgi:hypothetical protein